MDTQTNAAAASAAIFVGIDVSKAALAQRALAVCHGELRLT
jgi:hypothetical protein